MTYPIDILGRAPIMRQSEESYDREDDWTGEDKIRAQNPRHEKAKKQFRYRVSRLIGRPQ